MYTITCNGCQALVINGHASHEMGCNSGFIYTKRKKNYAKYRVFSLDVWGNNTDGFEVNDRSHSGDILIPLDASDKDIIKTLKKSKFLYNRMRTKTFSIDGDDIMLYVEFAKTTEPLYQLERV